VRTITLRSPVVAIILLGVNTAALVFELLAAVFLLFGSGWAGSAATFVFTLALVGGLVVLVHLYIVVGSFAEDVPIERRTSRLAIAPLVAIPVFVTLYWLIP
jgi:hypothetical protein